MVPTTSTCRGASERRATLGLRWLVNYARLRGKRVEERLANEIMDVKEQHRKRIENGRYIKWLEGIRHLSIIVGNFMFIIKLQLNWKGKTEWLESSP